MNYNQLKKKINDFNQIKNNLETDSKPKNIRGNQYELEQFNFKMKKNKYIQTIRNEQKGFLVRDTDNLDSIESVYDNLDVSSFSKPWHKINNFHKKQLIIDFLDNRLKKSEIDIEKYKDLKLSLFTLLEEKKLNKKIVEYDMEKHLIKNISIS